MLSCFNSVDDKMNVPLQSLQTGNQLMAFIYNLYYIVDQRIKSYLDVEFCLPKVCLVCKCKIVSNEFGTVVQSLILRHQ